MTNTVERSVLRAGCVALGAVALLLPSVAVASIGASPIASPIENEIETIRAEIRTLRASMANDRDAWLTEQRATEIRSLVSDVLADADTRASLQGSGMTAGWDNGFFLASPDGAHRLAISGYTQFRWNYNRLDNPGPDVDANAKGFENRRTYLQFDGHVIDRSWTYRIQGNFARSGSGNLGLDDAWIRKTFTNGFYVQAGQMKAPFMRETLVSDTGLLTVDRSLVEGEFGIRRTQGVFVGWSDDMFRVMAGYSDGHAGTGGQNSPSLDRTTEFAFGGRGEVKFGGTWSQFNDMTSFPDEETAVMIGAAVLWQRGEFGTDDSELQILTWTVDAEISFGGANLFGSFTGRHLDENAVGAGNQDQYAAVAQGGFFVAPKIEIFGRYEWADTDDASDNLSVITAGANWYLARNRIKLSGDIGYGLNGVSPLLGNGFLGGGGGGASWRADAPGEDGQLVIRTQAQLVF